MDSPYITNIRLLSSLLVYVKRNLPSNNNRELLGYLDISS